MTLVAIVGNLGSGKTLALTYLLFKKWATRQRTIYSNYGLIFPHIFVADVEDIDNMTSGIFGGDELWSWLDSRASRGSKNRIISSILLKSRKRDIDIIYTTQTFMQIDKRVRDITDYVIMPQMNRSETRCRLFWYDKQSLNSGNPMPISMSRFPCKPIFPLYDTKEEVKTLEK